MPVPVPAGSATSFAFEGIEPDGATPIHWCDTAAVHWRFNPANAPAGGLTAVTQAVAAIAAATGLTFSYDGTADAAPTFGYALDQRATQSWQPVVIGWTNAAASDMFAVNSGAAGMTQVVWWYAPGSHTDLVMTTGVIGLNTAITWLTTTGGAGSWQPVIEHELGHLVGLGHVNDPTQVMNPVIRTGAFGAGDLAGLTKAGHAGC